MTLRAARFAVALIAIAATAAGCVAKQATFYKPQNGYEEATLATYDITVATASGPQALRLSLKKLGVQGRDALTRIALPQRGVVLLQHRAGDTELKLDGREFAPLEGEWVTLTLPVDLAVATKGDSILMDVIVIEE
jgi:hypothetical protein